jgi:hypothetical protein
MQHLLYEARLNTCSSHSTLKWQKKLWSGLLLPSTPLVGDGVGPQPLGEMLHSKHYVSLPLITPNEVSSSVNGHPLKWSPNSVSIRPWPLGHALQLAAQVSQCWCLSIISCLEPVVPLLHLVQCLADTQVSSWWSPWSSASTSFTSFWGRTIWAMLDHPSVDYQWTPVCHPLLRETSTKFSSSCMWGCGRQCLSILDVVQPLFLQKSVLHLGHWAVPSSWRLGPSSM